MKRLTLQHLLLPQVGICTESALFFRTGKGGKAVMDHEAGALVAEKGAQCDFSTYFNGLSVEKWKKYTSIGNIFLVLKLSGDWDVAVTRATRIESRGSPEAFGTTEDGEPDNSANVARTVLDVARFRSDEPAEFTVPCRLDEAKGIVGVTLRAREAGSAFSGGRYEAEMEEADERDVDLLVDICTFRREPYLLRNLAIFRKEIFDDPLNPLRDHLRVHVSDNAGTLPRDEIASEKIRIVANPNTGGAGGFTRGLVEELALPADKRCTHVVMMDDDVVVEPESLFRTYSFLRCRKAGFEDLFVGGAMLRIDRPAQQEESGATWNAGQLCSNKKGLVLETLEACLYNETEETVDYNAWWFCCIPFHLVGETNLPLPIFIRGDDVEYGLRNRSRVLLLNGICVWHEPFEGKYSSFLSYYILRNQFCDNALHVPGYGSRAAVRDFVRLAVRALLFYRYKDLKLLCRGVDDFFKGPEFLLSSDGEALHKNVMSEGYRAVPADELPVAFRLGEYACTLVNRHENRLHRWIRLASFNGCLLPAKRTVCIPVALALPVHVFRARTVVNYNLAARRAFVTRKSWRETTVCLALAARTCLKLLLFGGRARRRFARGAAELQSLAFWKRYLHIEEGA